MRAEVHLPRGYNRKYNICMKSNRAHSLTIVGQHQVRLQNRTADFTLKQSSRIRGMRLEIRYDSGLTVVVPRRYSLKEVYRILQKKEDWILRHLPGQVPAQMPLFKKEIDHGERVQFMGRKLEVIVSKDGEKLGSAFLTGNKLFVHTRHGMSRARTLENWYREQAASIFREKAGSFQLEMGVRYNKITIRAQRKRWASASPLGNLSLNWKLLLAPEVIIDYVIMHELAHFKHMDHSKKFWQFLSRFCPNWREYRKWLVTHEDDLKARATFCS